MFKKFVVGVVAATTMWAVADAAPAMSAPSPSPSPAPKATSLTKSIKGPPPQSGTKNALATCAPECFGYAGQKYDSATSVITATKTTSRIAMPSRAVGDYHSLAETAVINNLGGGLRNIIEVGWNIDPGNGSDQPYLFVFAWYSVGGVQYDCGYNGAGASACGYIDNASNAVNGGSNINADLGTEQSFEIYHYAPSNAWIINYKGVQVGRYPDNFGHGVSFTTANQVQNFGEVASDDSPSCTNMGSGNFPNTNLTYPTHGAEFKGFNLATGGSYAATNYTGIIQNQPTSWTVYPYADGAFRYGGPGAGSQLYSPTACP